MKYLIYFLFFNLVVSQIHFSDLPDSTGVYQPVIIEQCFGLDIGDEIGLFDVSGLVSDDCTDQYSEILVGAGIYNGNQITISGFGALDYCDFSDGYQLPGWIGGNDIMIKVWDSSENIEYIPNINFSLGSGEWGDIYTVIDTLIVNELSINISDHFSLYDIYPNPFNAITTFNINHNINSSLDISIFDISGRLIENFTFNRPSYNQNVIWDASNYNSGIYIINFESSNTFITKKITLIK